MSPLPPRPRSAMPDFPPSDLMRLGGKARCSSQKGYLLRRGGCQNRWHSLVSCDHGDSTTSRFDSPGREGQVLEQPRGVDGAVGAGVLQQQPHHRHRLPPALRAKVEEREAPLVHAADVELSAALRGSATAAAARAQQLRRRRAIAGAQRLEYFMIRTEALAEIPLRFYGIHFIFGSVS
jgi:hypothetical protein